LSNGLTQGLRGSLRRRVRREIKAHLRDNRAIRRARYSFFQRAARLLIGGRSLPTFLAAYVLLDLVLVGAEVVFNLHFPQALPGWTAPEIKSLLKDIGSYLIAAQVGILGIVSVAIGIVTLISQRDDRSSTNTDVRLYYTESLAYEVVLSGAALLIVLCVQLLWPAQFLAHHAHLGGNDLAFKALLTAFHLTWLLLNLAVFAQFVLTTLHFVEPSARERLRERYIANVIVPADLTQRLLRVFYTNAPKELVPDTNEEAGPLITFGSGMLDDGDVELRTKFAVPSVLRDVWLRPLGFVLRRWWQRSERTLTRRRHQSGLLGRDAWFSLEPSFDRRFQGEVAWCRRRGGAALHNWERRVIRLCYRFRPDKYGLDKPPTPSNFIEELADRVIAQIERNAITGFKGAFEEFLRFHVFLLDAHNTQTDQGQPLSLAEVGDIWDVPYREWIRQYRRMFESAANKIGVETTFIETLGHAVIPLLPGDAAELSPTIVTSLLDLGVQEVIVLEAWVTRRTTRDVPQDEAAQPRLQLAGSERRAYEHVVRTFIGAWENVLRASDTLYGLRSRDGQSPAARWAGFAKSLPFLDKHLRNTAYLLASAIWNEDEIGAERYRDCLLRWMDTLRPDMQADILLLHHALLTTDLVKLDWPAVETYLQPYRRHPWPELPPPEAVFGIVLRRFFDDVLLVTAVVALAWHVHGQQSTDIGARAASLLLRRQVIAGEGSRFASGDMRPPTVFRSLFSLLIRSALSGAPSEGAYGAGLDGLVQSLNGMSERHVVPGRVYTAWGWRGLDQVRPQLLAMLAANLPAANDDDGVGRWVRDIAANESLFGDGDASLRRIDSMLNACQQALGEQLDQNLFERGVHALAPDADIVAARARLQALFTDAIAAIQEQRTQRLRALPIDLEKWNALTEAVSSALNPELYCFRHFRVERIREQAPTVMEWRVSGIDKARFVTPSMSWESGGDLNRLIAEMFREHLTSRVWWSFWQLPRESLEIDGSDEGFWGAVAQNALRVGSPATLLTNYDPFGAILSRWANSPPDRHPADRQIEYVQGHAGGGGTGYVGTIDGVEVFTADVEDGHSYVFSALTLDVVSYRLVAPDTFVSVDFEEGDNPWSGTVVVRFAQEVLWRDTPLIDLVTEDAPADEETPAAA
jgi:hypothetical protein